MTDLSNMTALFDNLKKTAASNSTTGKSAGGNNYVDGGDGDDSIFVNGNQNVVRGGNDNDTIFSTGDENTILGDAGNDNIVSNGNKNTVSGGDGDDNLAIAGNENNVYGRAGKDNIAVVGNSNKVDGGDDDDQLAVIGNSNLVNGGNGNDKILAQGDQNEVHGDAGDDEIYFKGSYNKIFGDAGNDTIKDLDAPAQTSSTTSTTQTNNATQTNTTNQTDNKPSFPPSVALSQVPANELAAVKGVDLNAVDKNGKPIYVVAKARDSKYHIYKQYNASTYKSVCSLPQGSNYLYQVSYSKQYCSTSDGRAYWEACGSYYTNSPLILDADKDGKVEAAAGKGVDINNDGIADGAATGGDKMLAMSDLNGNGKIDGQEVFGNETVSPFTGKKLNAANGFEALKMIAQEAEEFTGIKCIKNNQVDLQKLQMALEDAKKVKLGLISDDNITNLEALGDAAKISLDYTENDDNSEVAHRQLGNFFDTQGNSFKIDDIWFN